MRLNVKTVVLALGIFSGISAAQANNPYPWALARAMSWSQHERRDGCNGTDRSITVFHCAYLGWRKTDSGFETQIISGNTASLRISYAGGPDILESTKRTVARLLAQHANTICPPAPARSHTDIAALAAFVPAANIVANTLGQIHTAFSSDDRQISMPISAMAPFVADGRVWSSASCRTEHGISFDRIHLGGSLDSWRPCVEGIRRATLAALNNAAGDSRQHIQMGRRIAENSAWSSIMQSGSELFPENEGYPYHSVSMVHRQYDEFGSGDGGLSTTTPTTIQVYVRRDVAIRAGAAVPVVPGASPSIDVVAPVDPRSPNTPPAPAPIVRRRRAPRPVAASDEDVQVTANPTPEQVAAATPSTPPAPPVTAQTVPPAPVPAEVTPPPAPRPTAAPATGWGRTGNGMKR